MHSIGRNTRCRIVSFLLSHVSDGSRTPNMGLICSAQIYTTRLVHRFHSCTRSFLILSPSQYSFSLGWCRSIRLSSMRASPSCTSNLRHRCCGRPSLSPHFRTGSYNLSPLQWDLPYGNMSFPRGSRNVRCHTDGIDTPSYRFRSQISVTNSTTRGSQSS